MSDELFKRKDHLGEHQVAVTRKGVTLPCVVGEFGKLSKDNKGKKYPKLQLDKKHLTSVFEVEVDGKKSQVGYLEFFDHDFVVNAVNTKINRIFQEIYLDTVEATPEGKPFDWQLWQKDADDFTAGMQSLADLQEEINDLQDQATALTESPDFACEDEENPPPAYVHIAEQLRALSAKIGPLRKKQAAIKAVYAERIKKKEANAAAAAAATVAKAA